MKAKTLSILAGAAAFAVTGAASADYTGLSTDLVGQYEGNDIYRLYANFDGPGGVSFVGGEPGVLNFSIENITLEGDAGSGFWYQQAQSNATVFSLEQDAFNYTFDPEGADNSTWLTIGAAAGYDGDAMGEVFQATPGFNPAASGNTIGGEGGIVTNPGGANSLAVNGQVLLGQFAVAAGEHVQGTIGLAVFGDLGLGDTGNLDVIESFSTVPAPGALALLGVAGLVGSRRRRA